MPTQQGHLALWVGGRGYFTHSPGPVVRHCNMHAIYYDEVMCVCVTKYMMRQTTMSPVTEQ